MTRPAVPVRLREQFGRDTDRLAVWRALDLILPTSEYLNLGYSRWYQSYLFGSPQRRLVELAVAELMGQQRGNADSRVLDVGCGRGGTIPVLTRNTDQSVVGIDLVPYNVQSAVSRHATPSRRSGFVVGDASRLPFEAASFGSFVGIDSIVYMSDKSGVFDELVRVLTPGGVGVITDLLVRSESRRDDSALTAFTETWGMPALIDLDSYQSMLAAAGFDVRNVRDLSSGSVRRFKKWTWVFLGLASSPLRPVLERVLDRYGICLSALIDQVRTAHAVLESLQHVLLTVRAAP